MPLRPYSRGLSRFRREPVRGAAAKMGLPWDAYYVLTKAEARLTKSKVHSNSGAPDYDITHLVSGLTVDANLDMGAFGITTTGFSADSPTLVVDTVNKRVGFGTASPAQELEISAPNPIVRLTDSSAATLKATEVYYEFGKGSGGWDRAGWFGAGSSLTDEITLANESSGGHIILETNNGNIGIDVINPGEKLVIGSDDGSDRINIWHDNVNANIGWDDGVLNLRTAEGTNTNTIVSVKGKGTGYGFFRCYNAALDNWIEFRATTNRGFLRYTGSTHTVLSLQDSADIPIYCFENSTEGETQLFKVYGYRTDDASRSLQIGVGVDADDTVSFDGLSNYWFDGTIKSTAGAQLGDGGTTNYVDIDSSGKVVYVGTSGVPFGEIYTNDNAVTTSVSSAGFTQVTIFTVDGVSNNMTPDHANDHITVTKAGHYVCNVCATVTNQSGAGHIIELVVGKNNNASTFANMRRHRTLASGTDAGALPICGHIDLAVDDTIEVWVSSDSGTAKDIIVEDITLGLTMVGGT